MRGLEALAARGEEMPVRRAGDRVHEHPHRPGSGHARQFLDAPPDLVWTRGPRLQQVAAAPRLPDPPADVLGLVGVMAAEHPEHVQARRARQGPGHRAPGSPRHPQDDRPFSIRLHRTLSRFRPTFPRPSPDSPPPRIRAPPGPRVPAGLRNRVGVLVVRQDHRHLPGRPFLVHARAPRVRVRREREPLRVVMMIVSPQDVEVEPPLLHQVARGRHQARAPVHDQGRARRDARRLDPVARGVAPVPGRLGPRNGRRSPRPVSLDDHQRPSSRSARMIARSPSAARGVSSRGPATRSPRAPHVPRLRFAIPRRRGRVPLGRGGHLSRPRGGEPRRPPD